MDDVLRRFRISPTVALAIALMGILVMMVLPVPPLILDLGLTLSFAFAILIFTLTLFVERPSRLLIFSDDSARFPFATAVVEYFFHKVDHRRGPYGDRGCRRGH